MFKNRILFLGVLFLLAVFVSSGVYALSSDKLTDSLRESLDEKESFDVLVGVSGDLTLSQFQSMMDIVGKNKVKDYLYPYAFRAELSREEVLALASSNKVVSIEENLNIRPNLQDAVQIVGAVDAWEKDVEGTNMDGTGQTICIADTGVDFTHPDLADKNIVGCQLDCFDDFDPNTGACTIDCTELGDVYNGHGTHVAGIAGADGGIEGIAKGADIISLRVFDSNGDGSMLQVWRALDWCKTHAEEYNIVAVSLSLGTDAVFEDYCDSDSLLTAQYIDDAVNEGLAVVVASGNSGDTTGISLPACMSNAIPVAGTLKNDYRAPGSNYNWMTKLFAPGSQINSTANGGGYIVKSGTSMATPMVSASIAIINQYLEATGRGARSMNPLDIEQILFDSGEEIVDLPRENWSRINVNNALLAMDEIVPEVTLVSPAKNARIIGLNSAPSVSFRCEANDWQLSTVEFAVWNSTGGMVYQNSQDVSGESSSLVSFTVAGLVPGEYHWNCQVEDANGNANNADEDFYFKISGSSLGSARRPGTSSQGNLVQP